MLSSHVLGVPVYPWALGVQVKMRGTEREGTEPGTHQSMAGTEGCRPHSGAVLQNRAPEVAGGPGGSHHLDMGEVAMPSLHDVALGKKSLIDRQVEKQVLLLVRNSVVHPVLRAAHSPLPPAAGEGVVQAVGQKAPTRIYSDGRRHVVFRQGLDEMLWKKKRETQ